MNFSLGGDNAYYLNLLARYRRDPHSVPADWAAYFEDTESNAGSTTSLVDMLRDAYRRFGHLEAQIDPLGANEHRESALERLRAAGSAAENKVALKIAGHEQSMNFAAAEDLLRSIYAGSTGIEAEHLKSQEESEWLYNQFERLAGEAPNEQLLADALESIVLADEFESFMRMKFPTKKRFGSEGAETMIVFFRELLRTAASAGVREVVMGGMHRGRLATLAAAFEKSPAALAAELMGRDLSNGADFTGDVPYHLGYSGDLSLGGDPLRITVLPHPSHLIVVAPVALGYARGTGLRKGANPAATLCLLAHTDAAFSGQGLVAELLQISGIDGYSARGAVHLVVNNQIGFTTMPGEGRSSRYCTDFAMAVGVPVLHVNAHDPVAVVRAARLALAWHDRFAKDIVVDLVCFRRFGHNELDEPRFTQPAMWQKIDKKPSVRESFLAALASEGVNLAGHAEEIAETFRGKLRAGFDVAANIIPNYDSIQNDAWSGVVSGNKHALLEPVPTGIGEGQLRDLSLAASVIPAAVEAHAKVRQFYENRAAAIRTGEGINFATAEAMAFASLLAEGKRVRLSGQDAVRGTFTQRHLLVHDMKSGETFAPTAATATHPGMLELVNSPLSEYGVLSAEYGQSLADPDSLVIWEAQFGDFLNGAQVIVDQYIVSAEAKWQLKSGLVLMLPHGLEGQGPDHSSARIERIAQLCASANIVLAQPSTPANLFHLLRRQIHAPWRKPLFLIAPKSLLRSRAAVSSFSDMTEGTTFRPIIVPDIPEPRSISRVILCAGKVYYDLLRERELREMEADVALIRIEQFYPFPRLELERGLRQFGQAEVLWLQEEAENQGAWHLVQQALAKSGLRWSTESTVIARPPMAVCAGGSIERHEREQSVLFERAFDLQNVTPVLASAHVQ